MDSLSYQTALFCSDVLTKEEFAYVSQDIDWNQVPDNYIKYNDSILKKIDWGKHFDKYKALRLLMANIIDGHDVTKYPMHHYEYSFEEVVTSLQMQPTLLEHINISGDVTIYQVLRVARKRPEFLSMYDFNTEDITEEELLDLIKVGNKDFISKMNVDWSRFSTHERFKIIKASKFDENTLESAGAFDEDFTNPYHVREIIIKTGDEYLDLLNLDCLFPADWVKILRYHRHLYTRMNLDYLLSGDIYYLIQICMILPDFVEYITEDNAHKISSRGWEKLLVKYGTDDDNRLINLCDFSKIEQRSWRYMQKEKPELLLYRL